MIRLRTKAPICWPASSAWGRLPGHYRDVADQIADAIGSLGKSEQPFHFIANCVIRTMRREKLRREEQAAPTPAQTNP